MSLLLFLLLPWHLSITIVLLCLIYFFCLKIAFKDILLVTTHYGSCDDHGEHKDSSQQLCEPGLSPRDSTGLFLTGRSSLGIVSYVQVEAMEAQLQCPAHVVTNIRAVTIY